MNKRYSLRLSPAVLALVLLAHGGAVFALTAWYGRLPVQAEERLMRMHLVRAEPRVEQPETSPRPLPPKPVRRKPVEQPRVEPPVVAARVEEAPEAASVAVPVKPEPEPELAPVVAAAAPVAAPEPDPLSVEPPRFNADYLDNPSPDYPRVSRRMGEEGRVLLRVLVSAGGLANRVLVKQTSGYVRLDEAALDAVRRWRFVPAQQGGNPVDAWVVVPITFSLKG